MKTIRSFFSLWAMSTPLILSLFAAQCTLTQTPFTKNSQLKHQGAHSDTNTNASGSPKPALKPLVTADPYSKKVPLPRSLPSTRKTDRGHSGGDSVSLPSSPVVTPLLNEDAILTINTNKLDRPDYPIMTVTSATPSSADKDVNILHGENDQGEQDSVQQSDKKNINTNDEIKYENIPLDDGQISESSVSSENSQWSMDSRHSVKSEPVSVNRDGSPLSGHRFHPTGSPIYAEFPIEKVLLSDEADSSIPVKEHQNSEVSEHGNITGHMPMQMSPSVKSSDHSDGEKSKKTDSHNKKGSVRKLFSTLTSPKKNNKAKKMESKASNHSSPEIEINETTSAKLSKSPNKRG